MNTEYSEYSVNISTKDENYGSVCTPDQAVKISKNLGNMIEKKFPGVSVSYSEHGGNTVGPVESVCDEIDRWIEKNFHIACKI